MSPVSPPGTVFLPEGPTGSQPPFHRRSGFRNGFPAYGAAHACNALLGNCRFSVLKLFPFGTACILSLGSVAEVAEPNNRPLDGPAAAVAAQSPSPKAALAALEKAARGRENLMPPLLDCVRAYSTVGEICNRLRTVFGVYTEASVV
ncbi:MAG: hypothetical protein HY647_13220 [Acidobacteria bacterium]|nr:hypothetical protein [Acidobacteriota bacterium]